MSDYKPIDPADVKVGDVVEVEGDDWMVRGKVIENNTSYAPRGERWRLILHGPQFAEVGFCPDLTDATVRLVRRAELEPDPEQVEKLWQLLMDAEETVHEAGGDWLTVDLARELVRRGVTVRGAP